MSDTTFGSFDSFTTTRDKKKVKLKPKFAVLLRELIQNIPWSATLKKVWVRLTKDPSGIIIVEILDSDIGCDFDTFELSVLGEETEDGFKVVKKFANKFGQGLLNMVSNSSTNKMDLYMKKDGVSSRVELTHDVTRSYSHTLNPVDSPLDNLDSGFCVRIPIDISYGRGYGIKTANDLAKLFYNTLKHDLQLNLGRVGVEFDLVGFDQYDITDYPDHKQLQPKKTQYVHLSDAGERIYDTPQYYVDKDHWEVGGKKFLIDKIEYDKRIGFTTAKKHGVTEEQFRAEYYLADFKYYNGGVKPLDLSDKPIAFFVCNRTNLILGHLILRSGTTGQENRNHITMYVYIDIQNDVWGTEQTKEELMNDSLRDYVFDKLTDIIDDQFPPEQFKESAMQLFLYDMLSGEINDNNSNALFTEMGKPEWSDLDKEEKRKKIAKEDSVGKVRYDFSYYEDEDRENKVPIELKPKPFDVNAFRQGLEQVVIEDADRALFIGLDLEKKHRNDWDAADGRYHQWTDGKLDKSVNISYIDLRDYGYNKVMEHAYLVKVRNAHKAKTAK